MASDINTSFFGFEKKFEDPFILPSSEFIPKTLTDALDLAAYLYFLNPTYRKAMERAVGHFITNLKFQQGTSQDEDYNWIEFFKSILDVYSFFAEIGKEFACYGNAFVYMYYPFDRYLEDTENGRRFAVERLLQAADNVKFNLDDLTYDVTFKKSGKRRYKIIDIPSTMKHRLRLRKINPRDIIIEPGFCSGNNAYIYKIPMEWRTAVERGIHHTINDIPIYFLEAISKKKAFRFNSDEIFHVKQPTISGISNEGWGIPEPILNYRMLHKLQVYHKIDESIARDYMVPFRIFSPVAETTISTDVIAGQRWKQEVSSLIKNRRQDAEAIHALPFPIRYDEHGASGKMLSPKDLIEFQTNDMLDAAGVPAELYRANLSYQHAPLAFKVFENNFMVYFRSFNKLLTWVTEKIRIFTKEDIGDLVLEQPSAAADYERKSIMFTLYQAGKVSNKTVFDALQLGDPEEESSTRIKEDMSFQMEAAKAQEEAEREMAAESLGIVGMHQQMMGQDPNAMAAGGQMPTGGSVTPTDIMDQAEIKAQEWLQMPYGDRRAAMMQVKATDPNLYSMAKQKMEEIRSSVASEAKSQLSP